MYCFSTVEEFAKLRDNVRKKLTEMQVVGADAFFVAINEAVNNAIFHGNAADKNKKVKVTITQLPGEVRVSVCDEGRGFAAAGQVQEELSEHGRGMEIIKHCVDHYYFTAEPSEMVLVKKIAS